MSNQKRTVEKLSAEIRKFIASTILFNAKVADEVGLNTTDLQVLHLLELYGPATPGDLAKRAWLTTGGMTVVLDRLQEAGYLNREPNPADRRSSIVRLDQKRLREQAEKYSGMSEHLAKVVAAYKDRELELLLEFFTTMNTGSARRPSPAAGAPPSPGAPRSAGASGAPRSRS